MVLRFDILYGTNAVWDVWDMLVVWYTEKTPYVVWYGWRHGTGNTQYGAWYGKYTVCGMVREIHSMWHGTLAVWYDGTVSWIYYMAKFAWWYGMFLYIRSVRL